MSDIDLMLWLDLETNGEDVKTCEVLEIGAFFTDKNLKKVGSEFNLVVRPSKEGLEKLFRNPVVVEMHANSGLLTEISKSDQTNARSVFASWYFNTVDEWLMGQGDPKELEMPKVQLAGSGVASFDQQVLRYWCPAIFQRLYYACFDVGHFRRFAEVSKNEDIKKLASNRDKIAHRAMDDIEDHWQEAKRYLDYLERVDGMID